MNPSSETTKPGEQVFFSSPCLGWAWSVVVAASTVVLPRPEGSYFPTINPNWTCNGGVERRGTGGGFSPMCCDPFPVNLLCIALLLLPTTDCSVRSFSARILPFRGARIEHVDCHLPVPVWFIFTSWPAESECWWRWSGETAPIVRKHHGQPRWILAASFSRSRGHEFMMRDSVISVRLFCNRVFPLFVLWRLTISLHWWDAVDGQ